MRVLRDLLDRVTRVVDDDFLRGDEDPHRRFESLDVERAFRVLELHQVQRGEIAGGVIEKEIFRTRIGRILPARSFAGMPFVNGGIELHPGVTADMRAFRDFPQQACAHPSLAAAFRPHPPRPPFAAFHRGVHELVTHAHRQVLVLIHDRAIGVAVVAAVVTLLDQRPGLPLFLLLGVDEFLDVGMPVLAACSSSPRARLAAALHHVRDLIVNLQKRKRAARLAAAAQLLACAAQARKDRCRCRCHI